MNKRNGKAVKINDELTKLLARQADLSKNVLHTAEDISEYNESCVRVWELFAQLASKKVA